MEHENPPIAITSEQANELDRLNNQGLTYRAARERLGIIPVSREVIVISQERQPAEDARAATPVDETRQAAENMARRHGGHPDDYDWRYR